jgi:hypothetical protein
VPFADEHEALRRIDADPLVEALITGDELKSMSGLELCWALYDAKIGGRNRVVGAHAALLAAIGSGKQARYATRATTR